MKPTVLVVNSYDGREMYAEYLRSRGLRAAQCFGGRFGLRHGGTRLAGSEEALRAAQQLASDRLGQ